MKDILDLLMVYTLVGKNTQIHYIIVVFKFMTYKNHKTYCGQGE